MNYQKINDSTQREHIKEESDSRKYMDMAKRPSIEAIRKMRTKPYYLEVKDGKMG